MPFGVYRRRHRHREPIPIGKLVTQTEDVLVDTRGNIYITDKQWGLYILRTPARGSLRQQTKKESAVDSTCLLISAAVYCNCSSVAPGSAIECNQELELVLAFLPAAVRR